MHRRWQTFDRHPSEILRRAEKRFGSNFRRTIGFEFSFEYDGFVGRARDRVGEWISDRAAGRVLWLDGSVSQLSGSRQSDVGVLGSAAGVGWTFLSDGDSTGRNAHRTWGMIRRADAQPLAELGKRNWLHHMIFNELKLSNFCVYRGEHEFNLAPGAHRGKAKPVVLFGGMNGGG